MQIKKINVYTKKKNITAGKYEAINAINIDENLNTYVVIFSYLDGFRTRNSL